RAVLHGAWHAQLVDISSSSDLDGLLQMVKPHACRASLSAKQTMADNARRHGSLIEYLGHSNSAPVYRANTVWATPLGRSPSPDTGARRTYTVCRYHIYSRSEMVFSNSSISLSLHSTKTSRYSSPMYSFITSEPSSSRSASRRLVGNDASCCS